MRTIPDSVRHVAIDLRSTNLFPKAQSFDDQILSIAQPVDFYLAVQHQVRAMQMSWYLVLSRLTISFVCTDYVKTSQWLQPRVYCPSLTLSVTSTNSDEHQQRWFKLLNESFTAGAAWKDCTGLRVALQLSLNKCTVVSHSCGKTAISEGCEICCWPIWRQCEQDMLSLRGIHWTLTDRAS